MPEPLYHRDAYLRTFNSMVSGIDGDQLILEESAFYPRGGGQPSDRGTVEFDGVTGWVVDVRKKGADTSHTLEGDVPAAGQQVRCLIDWDLRYRYMRFHTALHIMSAVVLRDWGADVTGSNIADGGDKARMDFSLEGVRVNEILSEVERKVRAEVERELPLKTYQLERESAMKIPDLIRTHINLLPENIRTVRIVEIDGLDIQADGGTHVANTREVGIVKVLSGANKGKMNRRIEIGFADPPTWGTNNRQQARV